MSDSFDGSVFLFVLFLLCMAFLVGGGVGSCMAQPSPHVVHECEGYCRAKNSDSAFVFGDGCFCRTGDKVEVFPAKVYK